MDGGRQSVGRAAADGSGRLAALGANNSRVVGDLDDRVFESRRQLEYALRAEVVAAVERGTP